MPNDFITYRLVEQRLRRRVVPTHQKAKPVQWADVGDVEALETLVATGESLHDILLARLEDRSYREKALGNWLIRRYGAAALGPNPYLERKFDEIVARAVKELRSRRSGDKHQR